MKYNILINAFGISDSGGITVLDKMLQECIENQNYQFYIFCYDNKNIINLIQKYKDIKNLSFLINKNYGILYRLFYENFFFYYFIKKNNIVLIYNFSGSSQIIIPIPSLVKVQNLIFYSKELDKSYAQRNQKITWIKQVWTKRQLFLLMLKSAKNIEIQSKHVKKNLSEFIDVSQKSFIIKNDFLVTKKSFLKPKKYNFREKITFLYIVGPHFSLPHKNITDFVASMMTLLSRDIDFKIKITLTKQELQKSGLWDEHLDERTVFLGYLKDKEVIKDLFKNNTIMISTSVIETLGLHVIEGILNGVLCIVPDEPYSRSVYGANILKYKLFNYKSLINLIMNLYDNQIYDIEAEIQKCQTYLYDNEVKKVQNIIDIFDKVLNKGK